MRTAHPFLGMLPPLLALASLAGWSGCSEASVAVRDLPPAPGCSDATPVRSGRATYYTFADGSGNCMYDPTPDDLMIGAMNEADYDSSAACGACAVVDGPEGQIRIRIVDRCPECPVGDIDLSPEAFAHLADVALGRVPITWREVPCDVSGPIRFHYKPESNQWWTAVQIRNHRYPVARLEYLTAAGAFKEVARAQYNYFVEPGGMGPGPFTFRVTDTKGQALTQHGIAHVPGGDAAGSEQFPPCTH
jgi:expansin (peptidoglycan-binding protein)